MKTLDSNKSQTGIKIGIIIEIVFPYIIMIVNDSVIGRELHTNFFSALYIVILLLVKRQRVFPLINQNNVTVKYYNYFFLLSIVLLICSILNLAIWNTLLFIIMLASTFLYIDISDYRKEIKVASIIIMIFSMVILTLYNYAGFLSEWNSNDIAMLTSGSIYYVVISFSSTKHKILLSLTVVYMFYQIWITGCRSVVFGILYAVVAFLLIRFVLKKSNGFGYKVLIVISMLIPFLIFYWNVYYIESDFAVGVNDFFIKYTEKTSYTGREVIWRQFFPVLNSIQYLIIGSGQRTAGNLHSLVLDVWYTFGAVACLLYVVFIYKALSYMGNCMKDSFVLLCITSSLGLYVAQSFECMSSNTTYFCITMYFFFSIGIGRCLQLDPNYKKEEKL